MALLASLAAPMLPAPAFSAPRATRSISLSFAGADVRDVLEMVGRQGGLNVVVSPEVRGRVSLTLANVPAREALQIVARLARVRVEPMGNAFFITAGAVAGPPLAAAEAASPGPGPVSVSGWNEERQVLLAQMIAESGANAMVLGELQGRTSLTVSRMPFDEALARLLAGTRYSYTKAGDIYVIAEAAAPERAADGSEPYRLNHLDPATAASLVPPELGRGGLRVNRAANSLVLYGSPAQRKRLRAFLASIDQPGPRILLDTRVVEISGTAAAELGFPATGATGEVVSRLLDETAQSRLQDMLANGRARLQASPQLTATHGRGATFDVARATIVRIGQSAPDRAEQGVSFTITPYIGAAHEVIARISRRALGDRASPPVISAFASVREGETLVVFGGDPARARGPLDGPETRLLVLVTPRIVMPAGTGDSHAIHP